MDHCRRFGLWMSRHRFVELAPLWSFPVFLAVAHLPMYVEPRYGLPLVPFTLIFAAAAVTHLSSRIAELNRPDFRFWRIR